MVSPQGIRTILTVPVLAFVAVVLRWLFLWVARAK